MISLIVAAARDGAIGRDGVLPWHLSTDLRRFKALTTGGTVVMGRKTFESIGRPLPRRNNRVLSRDSTFMADGVAIFRSLDTALMGEGPIWVIGGAQIYASALSQVEQIHLSVVACQVPDADAWLPDLGEGWRIMHREGYLAGPKDAYAHTYLVLDRDPINPPFLGLDA